MARKPTVKEQRQSMIDAYFSDSYESESDPLVLDILRREKEKEQQATRKPSADFSDVQSTVSSAPDEGPESALSFAHLLDNNFVQGISSLADKAQSGIQQTLAGAIQSDVDKGGISLDRLQSIIPSITIPQVDERGNLSAAPVRADSFLASILSGNNPAAADSRERTVDELVERAANNDRRAKEVLDRTELGKGLLETAQDVANSPESFLSIIGGPTAILPAGTTYSREYLAGRRGGLSPEEADRRAEQQAAIEFGFSAIPTGKLFGVLGKSARKSVNNVALDAVKRIGATSAGEALEEGATTVAQLAADSELAQNSDSERVKAFAEANLPKSLTEYWDQVYRSMKAGALGGAAFDSPTAMFEASAEAGRRAQAIMSGIDDGKARNEAKKNADAMFREGQKLQEQAAAPAKPRMTIDQFQQELAARQNAIEPIDVNAPVQNATPQTINLGGAGTAIADNFYQGWFDRLTGQGGSSTFESEPQFAESRDAMQQGLIKSPADLKAFLNTSGPQQAAAPVAPVAPVVPKPPRKTKTKKAEEQVQADFKNLLKNLPKAAKSAPGTATTGVTLDEVGQALTDSAGSKGGGQVAGLVESGALNFVQSKSDLDIEGLADNAKGYYDPDSGKVYIVADQLDRNNIKGDVLSVLAHEVKHGADIGGSADVRSSFRNIVGDSANTRINQQIRNLARQDTPDGRAAKKVVDFVNEKYDPADIELELPAVYLQQQKGAKNAVMRNMLSAVRTRYKKVTGAEDINLKDLSYLADQLVSDVAANKETFKPARAGKAKSTFLGRKAKDFATAEELGLTYDSKDGGRKYWMSDRGSKVKFTDAVAKAVRDHDGDVTLKLSTIMDHPALYEQYPQLKDLQVEFTDNINPKFRGAYYPEENMIRMKKSKVDAGTFNTPTHQILLHEVQHAIQNIEGHEGGSNPSLFLPDSYDGDIAALEGANEQLAEFGRDAYHGAFKKYGVNMMDPKAKEMAARAEAAAKAEMDAEMYSNKNVDAGVAAAQAAILELSRYDGSYTEDIKELRELDKFAENLHNKTSKQMRDAVNKYLNNLGEREAKFTEQNIDSTNVPENPEATKFPTADVTTKDTPTEVVRPKASLTIPRDMDELEESTNNVVRIMKRLFTPTSGFGHELNEMRLHSRSLVASEAAKAEDLGRDLAGAIRDNVKQTGIPEDQLREQIEKEVDAIDELPTPEQRQARMDALDRKYPGVGRALNALRDYKLGLTRELIRLRARDPEPLTEKELAVYQKAVERAETYSTRAYLTSLGGKQGQQYARKMIREFKKNPNSPEGKKITAAAEWLINNQLMIPDLNGLKQMKMDQLRRLHDQWIGPADNFKGPKGKAQMIDRLDALERKSRADLAPVAMDVIKQLIGLTPQKGAIATHYAGGRQNRTILETRRNIPKELREVMGEITDPYLREMLSIARMTQLMSKTKLLTEIFERGNGRWWSDTKRDGFEQQLSGASYGPLAGKYANKDVFDMLSDVTLYSSNVDALLADTMNNPTALTKMAAGATLPAISKIAGLQKTAQIVLSPAAMLFNMAGAMGMILPQNGIMPGGPTTGRALRDAARVVHATAFKHQNPEALARTQEILRAGVMDSATVGEFQGKVYDDIFREIHRLNPDDPDFLRKAISKIRTGFGKAGSGLDFLRETYAFMDVWAKVATYYNRKDFLTEYNRLNGGGMTEEEIQRQAGYEAAATNISYNMAIPAVRMIERNVPVLTMFLTYFSEVPRSIAFSYAQVYKDAQLATTANTAAARNLATAQATKRFLGTTAVTAGLTAAVVAALDGEDDDERKRRQLDPEWERNNPRIVIGKDDKGNDVTVSLGRIDPNGPLNEAVRNVIMAPKGQRAEALMESAKGLFVKSESIVRVFQLLSDMATSGVGFEEGDIDRKKNTAIERNFPHFYNAVSNFLEAGDFGENGLAALEMFIPAPILGAMDPQRSPTTKENPTVSTAARLLGYKGYTRDADKNFLFRARDYNDDLKSLRSEKNDIFEKAKTLSESELTDRIADLTRDEKKAFDKLSKGYEGYLAFENKSIPKAYKVLEDAKVPKETIGALRYNRFQPTVVTPKTINDWYKNEFRKVPADERESLKQRRAMLLRVYAGKEE